MMELYYMNGVFIRFSVVLLYHYDNIALVKNCQAEKICISCRTLLDNQKKHVKDFHWTETAIAMRKAILLDSKKYTIILYYYSIFSPSDGAWFTF